VATSCHDKHCKGFKHLLYLLWQPKKKLIKVPFIWSQVHKTTTPQVTQAVVPFSCFHCKIQPAAYIRIVNLSQGGQLEWSSCLALVGRVTLASGTTFLEINALADLTGTTPRNLN